LQVFTPKTALGTVRIRETLPGTCPRMLRSKTGFKTELISRKERKTYFLPSFAISPNSQGSEVFSPAYTACIQSQTHCMLATFIIMYTLLTGLWILGSPNINAEDCNASLKKASTITIDISMYTYRSELSVARYSRKGSQATPCTKLLCSVNMASFMSEKEQNFFNRHYSE
jgi:hypothetical protein